MPDLSKTAVMTWFDSQGTEIATLRVEPVRPIEDDANVRSVLSEMGAALDRSLNKDASRLSVALQDEPSQVGLRRVLVQLGPARLFRVLHWLSVAGLPDAGKVLSGLLQDEPSGIGQMLRSAIQEMHLRELLARLFSPDRLKTLLAACQNQRPEIA